MSISYPLTMPATPGPTRVLFKALSQTALHVNQYTLQQSVYQHQGQLWMAEVTLPPMERAVAEYWNCFLLALNGPMGTFLMGDPLGRIPRGSASGAPTVRLSGQTGQSLNTEGWTPSTNGVLLAGDYIQLGAGTTTRLHKVLFDVNSSAAGWATLDIFPRLREQPANGTAIITSNCQGTFRLSETEYDLSDMQSDKLYNISFACMEAVEVV
jgi:hypothetical protein